MTAETGERLPIERTWNFRAAGVGVIRPGVLYRSDALDRLTARGRADLAGLGIGTVVDLRSRLDRRIGGRDRLRGTGATYLPVPISGVGPRTDPATITLTGLYRTLLTDFAPELARAIRTVAETDRPVLIHCTAGKDRTGVVVALLLSVAGVARADIVDDYARTGANLAGPWRERMLRRVRRFGVPITDQLAEVLAGSPPAAMIETLDWLDAAHGGVEPYLTSIGVDPEIQDRIRARLAR